MIKEILMAGDAAGDRGVALVIFASPFSTSYFCALFNDEAGAS